MNRALIIAPNWIGDALMAQPFFTLLKTRYPRLRLDAIAPRWVAPVLERMPEIETVYLTDFARRKLQLWRRWQTAQRLRAAKYAAAYILPNSAKSAVIPWFAGIGLRIGYHGEHRHGLLNSRHPNPCKKERPPMVRRYAALAYAPGAPLPDPLPAPRLEIAFDEQTQVLARFSLEAQAPLIVFCPGAEYGPAKRWPAEHFAMLAQRIAQAFPTTCIVALGSSKDAPLAQAIAERAPRVRNLCGHTSLDEACALIAYASAVISNDSGLMHIAAALRRPLLALYGSSDPRHTPPLSNTARVQWLQLECSPCFARECPLGHLNCLRELRPEQVFESLHDMLR
ncbi:lipopolysaccharide heptosyltransferase II [Candidatus Glomeribacter gigasporarum]|uniref:lipopolysaccharide heptosyltransferase II n=1 Tax=Candidatus Glomeribacter gigasporarum TaxID=132144 RepID=UPI0005B2E007|nr:lipopolysaccharide heptosyltransferase II [Candidatus Glomeribacter gigasporarum]